MLGIILFSISIMYTPGPVNVLSLNNGLQNRFRNHVPFSCGVASGMLAWILLVGYTGSSVIDQSMLPYVAIVGCGFILYLAYKIITAKVDVTQNAGAPALLDYKDGLLMQLTNPKTFLVVLPVATVQFPAAGIYGVRIALWSAFLSCLAFGAPMSYAALGALLGRRVKGLAIFKVLNIIMGVLLLAIAGEMLWEQVLPAWV